MASTTLKLMQDCRKRGDSQKKAEGVKAVRPLFWDAECWAYWHYLNPAQGAQNLALTSKVSEWTFKIPGQLLTL